MTDTTTLDRIVMATSGILISLGMFVLGILEALIGNPSPVPVTNDAGVVTAQTTFPVELRTGLVAFGFLLLAAYAIFRAVVPEEAIEEVGRSEPSAQ